MTGTEYTPREAGKPRLLDLFCGAGGAAMGYARAGFKVVGVDIEPQPHYPFPFVCDDALDFLTYRSDGFDAIHASPPCHDHSVLRHRVGVDGTGGLLAATILRLRAAGVPWVVENVPGSEPDNGWRVDDALRQLVRIEGPPSPPVLHVLSAALVAVPTRTTGAADRVLRPGDALGQRAGSKRNRGRTRGSDGHRLDDRHRNVSGDPAGVYVVHWSSNCSTRSRLLRDC